MSVRIANLFFNYPHSKDIVLKNINLEVNSGEVLVLLGNNGCGKTTLIKNIAGLLKPQQGSIFVDDVDLLKLNINQRSKIISYVSQKVNMLEEIPVLDYLTFGFSNNLKFYEKPKKEHMDKAIEYSNKLNIGYLLNKNIDEISGGERQIVSICSAIIQDTDLVILDEPTSALDIKNQHTVLSIIKDIASECGKTFILSSHNPNHALFLDSNVILLQNGKTSVIGNAKEIITKESLSEIYGENLCYSKDLSYDEVSFKSN